MTIVNRQNVAMTLLKWSGKLLLTIVFTFLMKVGLPQNNQNQVFFTTNEIFDSINKKRFDIYKGSVELSIIGNYFNANLLDSKSLEEFSFEISNDYSDAEKNILEKSLSTNILIINESHNHPEHRRFLLNILDSLYNQGYRYLAIEALTNNFYDSTAFLMDTSIYLRGFPLFSQFTGTYTREPEMGKLVRKSIDLGIKLIAYEKINKGDRELVQANNIYNKVFKKNKDAKLIVLCGYNHVFENPFNNKKWMAYYLKKLSGYDPLTIYQLNVNAESFFHFNISSPVIFNEYKIYFKGLNISNNCDIWVFHPIYRNLFNIPEWKFNNNGYIVNISPYLKKIISNHSKIEFPIIVRVFYDGEPLIATPYEIVEINSNETPHYVFLEKHKKYYIEFNGQVIPIIDD